MNGAIGLLRGWRGAKRPPPARRLRPQVCQLEQRCLLAGTITGTVYQDFNANGVRDLTSTLPTAGGAGSIGLAFDRGLAGITVSATDAAGTVRGTATTAANGASTLVATGSGPSESVVVLWETGALLGK